jgi:hypothetical protein
MVFAAISVAGTIEFLLGMGLFVSMRVATTTAAVVWTLSLYFIPRFLFWSALGARVLASGVSFEAEITGVFGLSAMPGCVYFVIGSVCMRAATRRLRCNVFEEDTRWFLRRSK